MSYYVFFTGLPKSYPQQGIRDLFARCGNVVSLRISIPRGSNSNRSSATNQNKSNNNNITTTTVSDSLTQSGLIEYADEASQQAAIALFNGYTIETPRGSVRIRVGASSGFGGATSSSSSSMAGQIRGRDTATTTGAGAGIENSAGTYKHEKFVDSDLSTSEHLIIQFEEKRNLMLQRQQQQQDGGSSSPTTSTTTSSFLPRRSTVDPLQASLLRAPEHELREAVEQLRVLCAEQPERAKMLLETFPQLRRAVCMILQKDEKLPIPLPPEAFIERHHHQQQSETNNSNSNKSKNDDENNKLKEDDEATTTSTTTIDPAEQEQIQNIINELSPEALAEMLSADFESQEGQMEESVRQHFIKIQKQLRAMTEEE